MIPAIEMRHAVLMLRLEAGEVAVGFEDAAAVYRLHVDVVDFAESIAKLAESWRTHQPVVVQVIGDKIVGVR